MANAQLKHQAISVNGRFLTQSITGVQRYAHEVLSAIDRLLNSRQIGPLPITVFVPPGARAVPKWQSLRVERIGRFTGQLWEQIDLAVHARDTLLFTPCGGAPLLHPRQVITIHDAAIFRTPHAYTKPYGIYYRFLQETLARRIKHTITVSDFSRRELMEYLHVPEGKISVTWNSGEHILRVDKDDKILEKHGLYKGSYILGVGSRNPNKNLGTLVEAFNLLIDPSIDLVIAGGSNTAIFGEKSNLSSHVREVGVVSDGELRSLYENAACFVFPSFYEGFGIPPLEALTVGASVVASRAAALPEVLGDAAVYCDPHSAQDVSEKIQFVLQGKGPGREAAQTQAAQYTWEQCARQTWKILLQAAGT